MARIFISFIIAAKAAKNQGSLLTKIYHDDTIGIVKIKNTKKRLCRYRLAWSRTSGSHPENSGSNPDSAAKVFCFSWEVKKIVKDDKAHK
jgi:hypothetical protein